MTSDKFQEVRVVGNGKHEKELSNSNSEIDLGLKSRCRNAIW